MNKSFLTEVEKINTTLVAPSPVPSLSFSRHAIDLKLKPRVPEFPGNLGFHWLGWEMTGASVMAV